MWPSEGWRWHNADTVVEGVTWGGNLETLAVLAQSGHIQPVPAYSGCVLLIETSEVMPSAAQVYSILRMLGECGLLASFPAAAV